MLKNINEKGSVPHVEISDATTERIDISELANKSGAHVTTYNQAGVVLDNTLFHTGEVFVVIAPPGNWLWETSANGIEFRSLYVMLSRAPDCYRINVTLNGATAQATWQRWRKIPTPK